MEPTRRKTALHIAIPASLVSDIPQHREKTATVGLIGRAAAIFRVDGISIYLDPDATERDASFIELLLNYMDTPQYLRKRLFPLKHELKYAGILHPLRSPHHPTKNKVKDLRIGEFREGLVIGSQGDYSEIDIGVEDLLLAEPVGASRRGRVTVQVTETEPKLRGRIVTKGDVDLYWGYDVRTLESMSEILIGEHFDLSIATSRTGRPLNEVSDGILQSWKSARNVLVAFGAPGMGLKEILELEGLELQGAFDFIVNTVPLQGSQTIRTEEAIYCTLSVFNLLIQS